MYTITALHCSGLLLPVVLEELSVLANSKNLLLTKEFIRVLVINTGIIQDPTPVHSLLLEYSTQYPNLVMSCIVTHQGESRKHYYKAGRTYSVLGTPDFPDFSYSAL